MGVHCNVLFIQGGRVVGEGLEGIWFDDVPAVGDTFVWTTRSETRRFKVLFREFHADAGNRHAPKTVIGVTAPSDASHSFGPWWPHEKGKAEHVPEA